MIERIGKVSTESVHKGTGKHWHEWMKILDKIGARSMSHQEIVKHLKTKHKLSMWWQQGVTLGYEIQIGRRQEGRNLKGEYSTVASRTFHQTPAQIWKLLQAPEGLRAWLNPMSKFKFKVGQQFEVEGGIFGEVRTMKANERVRLRWQDLDWPKPSVVNIGLISHVKGKTMLVFQHDQLKNETLRHQMNAHWKRALVELLELVPKK